LSARPAIRNAAGRREQRGAGADAGAGGRMQTRFLPIIEAQLGTLMEAITDSGASSEITRRLFEATEQVHYGRVPDDDQLQRLLLDVVRVTKPPILKSDWEESWGNLFTLLVEHALACEDGPSRIVSLLYGEDGHPPEAAGERILCINPGSTSTKVALYRGIALQAADEVHIPPDFADGVEARSEAIIKWVERQGVGKGGLTGVACRGGFVKPVPTGTYDVCGAMVEDLAEPRIQHASNLAIPIGMTIRERFSGDREIMVTMTDPVASDEMDTTARLTGIARLLRDGAGAHYLNHNAVHRLSAALLGERQEGLVTIGAHLGGGISIVRHQGGRIADLVNAFAGVPSANRSGSISLDILLDAIDENRISLAELRRYLFKTGGLIDLTGTNDFRALLHFRDSGAVEQQRRKIEHVIEFMAYSIAGAVMRLGAVEGAIDLVILTGGLSRSAEFTGRVKRKLFPYFPVVVIPGSIEHESMIAGHLRARYVPGYIRDYAAERDALRRRRGAEQELLATEIFSAPHLRRKENVPVTSLDELMYLSRAMVAKSRAPRIAIVGADNEDANAAEKQANEDGRFPVAKFILVGNYYEVNRLAWEYDIKVAGDNYRIADADDPVARAVELLDAGEADLLMKGSVKTSQIMGGALRYLKSSGRIQPGRIYSHVGFFQIPTYPKLLAVTDAALIPNPDNELRAKILENALRVCKYLNIETPRVAAISAVETVNPSVESSKVAADFAEMFAGRDDCIVEGPLSLDVAMDPHSARENHYQGRIRGNADILLMPDIEAGNVVYKSLTVSSGAYLAGAIVGAGIPIVLTSRGDSARSKLASICLACIVAMKQGFIE
ncbi:MAG: butyrate kinase, partial [Candidatus Krumholzibacteria bacterium]|nr:butyrate kinase [Candidatus Krumholzibacteria bacterium]